MHVPRRLPLVLALAIALVRPGTPSASAESAIPTPLTAPTTMTVRAGAGSADQARQLLMFFPATTTIDVGDRVTWALGTGEGHTVTFGDRPAGWTNAMVEEPFGGSTYDGSGFVSSGILAPPGAPASAGAPGFTLTFTNPGTFRYRCLFHEPAMAGTVVVQPAGTPYPAAPATSDPAGDPRVGPALQAAASALAAQRVERSPNPNGTSTYTLSAGVGDGRSFSVLRFGASTVTIRAGDSVRWRQSDPGDVHTVTFLNGGPDVPFALPPSFHVNPVAAGRAGGPVYAATGLVNSGILPPPPAPERVRTFALTFPRPGTYAYRCLVHDDFGMQGTIRVLAASPAQLPRTGEAPLGAAAALVALGLALIGTGALLWKRARLPAR
jgi:plastocyanin